MPASGVSRRALLLGAGGLVAGIGGAAALRGHPGSPGAAGTPASEPPPAGGVPVPADGVHQAGVTTPAAPQPHGLLAVWDLDGATAAQTGRVLAALGVRILALTDPARPETDVVPDGPGDLTVTVGAGPRLLSLPGLPRDLPGAGPMPTFAGDDRIDPRRRDGDLLVALHATDPTVLPPVLTALERAADAAVPGLRTTRWAEHCFRAPGEGTVARSPLGYLDGIQVPRTEEELAADVWVSAADHPAAAGGTVVVLRRLVLDLARFSAETPQRRDEVVGRRRSDGAPLSGGVRDDEVDLRAKTPEGAYLTPARSHARAAHPSFTGSGLMLRRSYGFAAPATGTDGGGEQGVFFISFQRTLETFVRTQQRLDEVDDLMGYVTPTASGSFLVLPGFDAQSPLGSGIFPTV
ncbi:peroxidase [Xylanimonas oleitrophica]|uniref:Peroxidase n=1 Tax=Xylanimonas oleitrophica TaxID=2607479 RepID=A0A2W5XXN8_9MICO|nr:peroxidase [Xylanimonas oleitrophica]